MNGNHYFKILKGEKRKVPFDEVINVKFQLKIVWRKVFPIASFFLEKKTWWLPQSFMAKCTFLENIILFSSQTQTIFLWSLRPHPFPSPTSITLESSLLPFNPKISYNIIVSHFYLYTVSLPLSIFFFCEEKFIPTEIWNWVESTLSVKLGKRLQNEHIRLQGTGLPYLSNSTYS